MAGDCLGEGVYSFKLQPDGSLAQRKLLRADNPSFVCASESGEFVYVVHEVKPSACTMRMALCLSFPVGLDSTMSVRQNRVDDNYEMIFF